MCQTCSTGGGGGGQAEIGFEFPSVSDPRGDFGVDGAEDDLGLVPAHVEMVRLRGRTSAAAPPAPAAGLGWRWLRVRRVGDWIAYTVCFDLPKGRTTLTA